MLLLLLLLVVVKLLLMLLLLLLRQHTRIGTCTWPGWGWIERVDIKSLSLSLVSRV